ncbi:MAG: glycoside hydrolase family 127 protein, partial [Steroidobacteraceae bacterium]
LIALIVGSQQPDGYLFPARTVNPQKPAAGVGTERWQYENTGSHELYNSGHLYEAAVAHFQATGSRSLLDVAVKNANLVNSVFGPSARKDAPGHEEIELALVKLYRATNDARYLQLSKFFLDERGTAHNASLNYTDPAWELYNNRAYRQDDQPLVDQLQAEGHAVRATYVYNAMTDIATMLSDPAYGRAVDRLWPDVVSKRIYLTGGLGSIGGTEAFGDDYALPNGAYAETCASVGGILWDHRMFLKSGSAKYLDAFEQTLYNGLLSGVSVEGDSFLYQNPLESTSMRPGNARSTYFDVACCPANLSRLLAQLPGLVYAQRGNELFVNLYMDSEATVKLDGGTVRIKQTTYYPWDGRVRISVSMDKPTRFTLKLRAPGWLGAGPFASDLYTYTAPAGVRISGGFGSKLGLAAAVDGWISVPIANAVGDRPETALNIDIPMPIRRVVAHARVTADEGKSAIQRGPIVYCLEGVDNGGSVRDVVVPMTAGFTQTFKPEMLGGVTTLTATIPPAAGAPAKTITAIPYFAWANRGRGEMVVWIKK